MSLEVDFALQDRFCDANDLKTAWHRFVIPEPLLTFFSYLFNFDAKSFISSCQAVGLGDDAELASDVESGVSASRCRQILALFQIMYYNLHNGKRRTPLHILNSQAVYDTCKSATLLEVHHKLESCKSASHA